MKKMFMLVNALMKNAQSASFATKRRGTKSKNSVGMIILYIFLLLYFGAISIFITVGLNSSLEPINQQGIIISMILVLVTLLTLFFSIFSCINVYYLSSDIEYLLPLPLRPHEILLAKFIVLTIYTYIFEFALALPSFVTYGIMNNESVLFYLYSLIILIFLPVIPLIIASLIVMVLMSFINLTKHRDKFVFVISALGIVFAVLINVLSSRMIPQGEQDAMILLQTVNALAINFGRAFPFIIPAISCLVNALSVRAILNFIFYIVINIAAIGLFSLIGNSIYFKGALGSKESSSKKKMLTDKEISKEVASRGQLFSFILKEWRLLYRNPTYLFQCVMPTFIFPVLFFVLFKFNKQYEQLFDYIARVEGMFSNPFVFTILVCILTFFLIGNTTSGSAISRDGSYATVSKYLPMDFYKQFIGKIFLGCVFSIVEVVFTMIVFASPLKLTISNVIFIIVIISIIGIVHNYLMFIVDLKRPKLVWDSEISVVKNNLNIFIDMIFLFVNMLIVFLIGLLLNKVLSFLNPNTAYVVTALVLIVIHVLAWFVLDLYVKRNKIELFSKIE